MSEAAWTRRAEGRQRVAGQLVWTLVVRGFRVRCLAMEDGNKVEARAPNEAAWKKVHYSERHPLQLLRQVVEGDGTKTLFDEEGW